MAEKRSSVLFNKNASPFVPAVFPVAHYPPINVLVPPYQPPIEVLLLELILPLSPTSLVQPPSQPQLEAFLANLLPPGGYTVVKSGGPRATLVFPSSEMAEAAAEVLHGRQWLDGEVVVAERDAAAHLGVSSGVGVAGRGDSSASATSASVTSTSTGSESARAGTSGSANSASFSSLAPLAPSGPPDLHSGPPNYPGFPEPLPGEMPYLDSPVPGANPYYLMPPPYGYPMDYGYYGNPMPYPPFGYYGVSPMSARTQSRRSSSRSLSRQNSVNSATKPTPPFLLNMAKRDSSFPHTASPSGESSPLEGQGVDMDDLISVEDDEGNPIKVNPRRLFVGNIPFNSTWPALKNFLITKAEELEPGNNIDILRVEIPMQQPRDISKDVSKLNSYQFLTLLSQQLQDKSGPSTPEMARANSIPNGPTRGLSRGFAIVTTANKLSLDKIIKYFDNVEFEGRTLTVRYDRFPDFNNYVLQQLYPSNKNHNKPAFLSNLAFERNSFQQKFYYGLAPAAPYKHRGSRSKYPNEFSPYNEFTMDELATPLDEIEGEISEVPSLQPHEVSDEEKARELVNSIVARDLST